MSLYIQDSFGEGGGIDVVTYSVFGVLSRLAAIVDRKYRIVSSRDHTIVNQH